MANSITDIPVRTYMTDIDIKWRKGKPDYSIVNRKYMLEKSRNHATDSLEKTVENIVKTWEMESTHKYDLKDWQSIVKDDSYYLQMNGGIKYTAQQNVELGNYNMMLIDSPFFDVKQETNETAHKIFKTAFPEGFAWEVLECLSGPPKVAFTWRHWTNWTGPYKDREPTGEKIEMFGSCVAEVTEDLKLKYIQVYFDPNPVMAKLTGLKCPFAQKI